MDTVEERIGERETEQLKLYKKKKKEENIVSVKNK